MFIDRYEQPDIVEDGNNFLKLMDELKPYTVEFEKDGTMKPKKYLLDCARQRKSINQSLRLLTMNVFLLRMMIYKEHRLKLMTYFCNLKDEVRVL